jgi:hypothetical protein
MFPLQHTMQSPSSRHVFAADGGTGLIQRLLGVKMGQEWHLNHWIENNNTYENRN